MGAGVGSAGSAWTVGAVCKDSNSLMSARSILSLLISFYELLLGKEQKKALKEHVRNKKGKVSAKRMIEEVMEILNAHGEGKN